jgi:hypothetical protein
MNPIPWQKEDKQKISHWLINLYNEFTKLKDGTVLTTTRLYPKSCST